ncbi:MAG: tellurium resistance protein TerC [Verrucomicrobiae bacterium]|nr:tellurium resistance protein TerC [Verrucomicrobiae bacterium]NNJ41818.1 tellurium resistance protein TerC [Akkermansiaceae bacterium]
MITTMRMENLFDLAMLIMLQAVLGFDNLLYISLESKRAPLEKQKAVRIWGIALAVLLRIGLLFLLLRMMDSFKSSLFQWDNSFVHADVNFASLITLFGGAFIIYTAIKEVVHMLSYEEAHAHDQDRKGASVVKIVALIVMMNLVFSFDSILSAMAITKVAWVMTTAIVISGILMVLMADKVSVFLQKNRLYEVLGLFILLIVGILLVSEGGHQAHLSFFGHPVEAMSKTTFYFVIAVLVLVDIIQGRYQKKLMAEKEKRYKMTA